MNKITLTEEKETLLIPLLGKAQDNKKENPILNDKKATEIVEKIDYNFNSLKIFEKTNIMMCIRAKLIDNHVKSFLSVTKNNVALHLGCGLDSRYYRIKNNNVNWYDLDFKEVITIRQHFFKETGKYHMIASSVTESEWIERIPQEKDHYIIIAEGLFMYLKENEIKELLSRLKDRIGNYTLIFDAYSVLTAKNANRHPSLKKTGAKINWGINNPEELENWGLGIKLIDEEYFTDYEGIDYLSITNRIMFKIANIFSAARKAHRLLIYRVCSKNTDFYYFIDHYCNCWFT
ncbi:class I SAM-dependent methyltransferase [Iocasia frigidifontis]|uniref:class I SAM-dependent methyltransferase n=1 Tax=Iocasia fonsfrigidae TaxID=2682810 RepID=UPI001E57AA18|nr:class I SAM-dependent methyltransferase [Iocasia fonsfrigidae]